MRKWERKFKKYLSNRPKRNGQIIYAEGNPANSTIPLGSPFSFGSCVLWGKGEYEKHFEEVNNVSPML